MACGHAGCAGLRGAPLGTERLLEPCGGAAFHQEERLPISNSHKGMLWASGGPQSGGGW